MVIDVKSEKCINYYFRKVERSEIVRNQYCTKGGWSFDWLKPINDSFEVYGLVTEEFPDNIQGLIALKANYHADYLCVDVEIIESAPDNKNYINRQKNQNKRYEGIGKCLVAFACQFSIDKGLQGFMQLTSKTRTLNFYADLGGKRTYNRNIMFSDEAAKVLSEKYFPRGVIWWGN